MSERLDAMFNGLPIWTKAMLLLSSVAFSSVVAVFFLAQSAGYIPSTQVTKEQLARHEQVTGVMLHVLYRVCVNTATDSAERAACWPVP